MATITIQVRTEYDVEAGFKLVVFSPSSSTSNRISIAEGDTVVFHYIAAVGGAKTVTLRLFDVNTWTSTADIVLSSVGQTSSKTVKSGGTLPNTAYIQGSYVGSNNANCYFNRVSNIDTTPDAFDLGAAVTNANPSQQYYSNQVTITGINTSVTASCNNGGLVSKNNGAYVSSTTVVSGDKIRVRQTASASYGATLTTTLTVGGTTDTFSITNKLDPGSGQIIYLGITSGQIKLSQIGDLFGRPQYVAQTKLSDYLKAPAGSRVPAITANANIPTTFPLKLTNFYGSATSFYVSTYPQNKAIAYDTTSAGGNFNLEWEVGVDWFLGFHPDVAHVAEYMYSFTETGSSTGVVAASATTWSTWSKLNKWIQLGVTVPTYVERAYKGTLTIYARHPKDPAKVVSATVSYWFDFYGP